MASVLWIQASRTAMSSHVEDEGTAAGADTAAWEATRESRPREAGRMRERYMMNE
jgi:hypothetical protein